MFHKLVDANRRASLAILRLVLGLEFFAHGTQKMLGVWGGYGFPAR